MSIFSRIFRKEAPDSPLKALLRSFSFEHSASTYKSISDEDLRLPAALSVCALHLADRFADGLSTMVTSIDKGAAGLMAAEYDGLACEAAAFVHFWLLQDFLADEDDDDDDDDDKEEDPYFECLKASAALSNSFLTDKAPAAAPPEWVTGRAMAYSHARTFKNIMPAERFCQFVNARFADAGRENLPLRLSVSTYVPIFISTRLEQFKKSARAMYLAHVEGAL